MYMSIFHQAAGRKAAFFVYGILTVLATGLCADAGAQTPARQVYHHAHVWTSVNSMYRLSPKWGLVGDLHIRRSEWVKTPSIYLFRAGGQYWLKDQALLSLSYGHILLAPNTPGWVHFANEHRLMEQVQTTTPLVRGNMVQRFRLEQRWVQAMANDAPAGYRKFSHRFRYMLTWNVPLSKNWWGVLSDEVFFQAGRYVVYNTFDQNRLFVGLRHPVNRHWSYDFGYMQVLMQRPSGYQYDVNHTLRWFFYYNGQHKRSGS